MAGMLQALAQGQVWAEGISPWCCLPCSNAVWHNTMHRSLRIASGKTAPVIPQRRAPRGDVSAVRHMWQGTSKNASNGAQSLRKSARKGSCVWYHSHALLVASASPLSTVALQAAASKPRHALTAVHAHRHIDG